MSELSLSTSLHATHPLASIFPGAALFDAPADLLRDPHLSSSEKRSLLSAWASDAHVVEGKPWLRLWPGGRSPVPVAEILRALRALDDDDDPPRGGAALRPPVPIPDPFDPTRCPVCSAAMRLARVEPRPGAWEFERHVYRCDACANVSRFVVDRRARGPGKVRESRELAASSA